MTPLVLSHVLYRVDDLPAAVADYRDRGFTVTWGGPPASAHNALIWFETGPFLELLLAPETGRAIPAAVPPAALQRFERWGEGPPGWCDLALETPDPALDNVVASTRAAGIAITDPHPFSRTKPDGSVVRWQLAFPEDVSLPFVMSAYDPPQSGGVDDTSHANGTQGIERVVIASPDPEAYRRTLTGLMSWDDPAVVVRPAEHGERAGVAGIEFR